MRTLGCLLVSLIPGLAAAQGLPFPSVPQGAREQPPELAELARKWAPDIYQDTDDSNAVADLLTDIDFDGDAVMTNNWENLEGRTFDDVLAQGSVYWWGSSTATHHYIGYSFFHPRDWTDYQSPLDKVRPFVRSALNLGDDEHENDMEGILLVISRETNEPVLMITQAHNHYWQYGSSDDWGDGLDDLDGPLLRDPVSGRPQVFIEAKGHGAYGHTKKTNFKPGNGDGVVYTRERGDQHGGWDGAVVTGYALHDLEPWWKRFNELKPGESDETFTREGGRASFRGETKDADKASPPWGWKDKDYPESVNRRFFTDPARFVRRVVEPKREFDSRIVERSFPPRYGPTRTLDPRVKARIQRILRGIQGALRGS